MKAKQPIITPDRITEIEVTYQNPIPWIDIKTTKAMVELLRKIWNTNIIECQEECKVVFFNSNNALLGFSNLSLGGLTSCSMDIRTIFAMALKVEASSIVLAHNHPSGNTKPSTADIQITEKIVKAGELLNIKVQDHIILTRHCYCSFFEEGLL
jgi:DNA repair protein RadC